MHVRAHRGGERVAHSSQSAEPSLFQSIRSTLGSGGIRDRFSLTDCAVLKQTRNVTNSDTNCREPTYFGRPTIYLLGTVQLPRKGRLNRIKASLRHEDDFCSPPFLLFQKGWGFCEATRGSDMCLYFISKRTFSPLVGIKVSNRTRYF